MILVHSTIQAAMGYHLEEKKKNSCEVNLFGMKHDHQKQGLESQRRNW